MSARTPFSPYHRGSPSVDTSYGESVNPSKLSTPPMEQTSPMRLKLILPPLKGGKPSKGLKKGQEKVKGPPRPPKLKPLKEVLSRLISQIKKKDEYGFFLTPVDASKVPGYSDAIKRPMDLGTMSTKVSKGKYRTLEDFASDIRLVMANAKTFNPPGSIYYAEADRIEAWALEQIAKAAPNVIELETDWNVEVEGDEAVEVAVDDGSTDPATPAPETSAEEVLVASGRRIVPRFAVPRTDVPSVKEKDATKENGMKATLDAEGHLPGYRDGVGQFPPDSEWARVMLELKIKNKQYKTKKERLRIEKEGLPHAPDGSLDYFEVQDPFFVLSALLPDPPTLPQLIPLYQLPTTIDPSQTPLPAPTAIYLPQSSDYHAERPGASPSAASGNLITVTASTSTSTATDAPKRKYFTITRTAPTRGAVSTATRNAREDTAEPSLSDSADAIPARSALALDYGSYAPLLGVLAASGGVSASHAAAALGTDERLRAYIRAALDAEPPVTVLSQAQREAEAREKAYWTDARARDGMDHLKEVAYGGVDGWAYVRSIAEFVGTMPLVYRDKPSTAKAVPTDRATHPLGEPLTSYVQRTVVNPLTSGKLRILQDASDALKRPAKTTLELRRMIEASTLLYPHLATMATLLRRMGAQPADAGDLGRPAKRPREGGTEDAGLGKRQKGGEKGGKGVKTIAGNEQMGQMKTEDEDVDMDAPEEGTPKASDDRGQEDELRDVASKFDLNDSTGIARALTFVADSLVAYETRRKATARSSETIKTEDSGIGVEDIEDETLRKARLCLLALARVAPSSAVVNVPHAPAAHTTSTDPN